MCIDIELLPWRREAEKKMAELLPLNMCPYIYLSYVPGSGG